MQQGLKENHCGFVFIFESSKSVKYLIAATNRACSYSYSIVIV